MSTRIDEGDRTEKMPQQHQGLDNGSPAVPLLAGLALLAAPPLLVAGIVTSPPQASDALSDYIASLARDPMITAVSATAFHYGWVLFGLGVLATIGLVRGRRGRGLTVAGAVLSAFGAVQLSGLLLNDWFYAAIGNQLSPAQALAVAEASRDASTELWLTTAKVGAILAPVLLFAGLARAGVTPWWMAALAALPMVVPPMLGGMLGLPTVVVAVLALACWSPVLLAGWRLLNRARLIRQSAG
jgi:hypothetical protein